MLEAINIMMNVTGDLYIIMQAWKWNPVASWPMQDASFVSYACIVHVQGFMIIIQ